MIKDYLASLAALAIVVGGCSANAPGSDAGDVASSSEQALSTSRFTGWTAVPGSINFMGTPAIRTTINGSFLEYELLATGMDQKLYENYRYILSGTDSGWNGWTALTAPVAFSSSPTQTLSFYSPPDQKDVSVAAARANPAAPCAKCIYLNLSIHGQSSTWYAVPSSAGNFTGDISMVYANGYLYLFVMQPQTGGWSKAYFTRNDVTSGYVNSHWQPFAEIPGGGQFHGTVTATATSTGLIVTGLGTDDEPYATSLYLSTWDGYWWYAWPEGYFRDRVWATSWDGYNMQLFGLSKTVSKIYEGDVDDNNVFDGWRALTAGAPATFVSSPSAWSPASGRIDLAARAGTLGVYINTYK